MSVPAFRVYVSMPGDHGILPQQQALKQAVIKAIQRQGFEPQSFGLLGKLAHESWDFKSVIAALRSCQGALILGLPRWVFDVQYPDDRTEVFKFITEWSHYEGAIAIAQNLPTLLISEDGVMNRGILYTGGGKQIVYSPVEADGSWVLHGSFTRPFEAWANQVKARYHAFVGYSSGAKNTAQAIISFLRANGVRVMDWMDFQAGGTILSEIERAEQNCLGGIFLFTGDDELVSGGQQKAAPRDNVIFEAGYFIEAKGQERVLIIRESEAKMPADVGGQIYLDLKDRNDISTIQNSLLKFVQDRL